MGRYLDLLREPILKTPECGISDKSDQSTPSHPLSSLMSLLSRPVMADEAQVTGPVSTISATATEATKATKAEIAPPLRLSDGRLLYRIAASEIPETVPDDVVELVDQAHARGAVLVADGCELIIVERLNRLPPEMLAQLCDQAGAVIAALRGEHRHRAAGAS